MTKARYRLLPQGTEAMDDEPVLTVTKRGSVVLELDENLQPLVAAAARRLEADPVIAALGLKISIESVVRAAVIAGLPLVGRKPAERTEPAAETRSNTGSGAEVSAAGLPRRRSSRKPAEAAPEPVAAQQPVAAAPKEVPIGDQVMGIPGEMSRWDEATDEIPDEAKEVFAYYEKSREKYTAKEQRVRGYHPYRLRLVNPETNAMILGIAFWARTLNDQKGVDIHPRCKQFPLGEPGRGGKGAAHVFVLVSDAGTGA